MVPSKELDPPKEDFHVVLVLRNGRPRHLRRLRRGLCHQHANFHDELTLAKSDTSSGYATYFNVNHALKCSECRLEWKSFGPGK